MTSLSVSSGSSLQLPTNCTFDPSNHYELHSGNQLVGSYGHDYLAPRLQFTGRLQFDLRSCSFKLINLTEKDSGIYTFVTKYDEKKRIQSQKEDFNITVTGRTAPESPRNNASYNNEDNTFGLLAICFLLDPSVAAITMGIYRLFLWFVKKCRNPCPGARPPCWHHTSSFLVGDTSQNVVNSAFAFGEWFSLVPQVIGTVLLILWKINGHERSVMWPIFSAISLIVEVMIKCSRFFCARLQRAVRCCLHYLMLSRPFLMSGFIVVVFSVIHWDVWRTRKTWCLCAAAISLMTRVALLPFCYRELKNKKEKNKEDPNSML